MGFSAGRASNQLTQTRKGSLTWWQEIKKRFSIAPLGFLQANKSRCAPQVSYIFAVISPLRQLKQTRFCWVFNFLPVTVSPPSSTTTLTEYRNCSLQQCLVLMGNQKKSDFLKICSNQVWKLTTNSRKKTEYTISTLSCVVKLCRRSKTSAAPVKETWKNHDCVS